MELVAISNRIFTGFPKTSWVTPKHHQFNARIPKKLVNAIRENAENDKKDDSGRERLFRRVAKIYPKDSQRTIGNEFSRLWRSRNV